MFNGLKIISISVLLLLSGLQLPTFESSEDNVYSHENMFIVIRLLNHIPSVHYKQLCQDWLKVDE